MKTILVPVDFSDSTRQLLDKATELARELSAKILLLHVVEPTATYVPVGATMDVITAIPPIPENVAGTGDDEQRLRALAQPLKAAGIDVDERVIIGLAVDDILEQAAMHKADYIILGSHGHGALYHLFGGSVVTGVLKRASCPVIVVPVKREQ